jgi:hypothetical protein
LRGAIATKQSILLRRLWIASLTLAMGLKGQIPLYQVFSIDELSLPRLKDLAMSVPGAQQWVNDLPNETNKKFVAERD